MHLGSGSLTLPFSTSSLRLHSRGRLSSSAFVSTFRIWTTSSRLRERHSIAVCQWFDWKNSSWRELFDMEWGSFVPRRRRIGEAEFPWRELKTLTAFVYSKGNVIIVEPCSSRTVGLHIECLRRLSTSPTPTLDSGREYHQHITINKKHFENTYKLWRQYSREPDFCLRFPGFLSRTKTLIFTELLRKSM